MTANNAAEIARQLSAGERDALQDCSWNKRVYIDERDTTLTVYDKLFLKGLLQKTSSNMHGESDVYYSILPLGRDVLAALQPAPEPAQAGGPGKFDVGMIHADWWYAAQDASDGVTTCAYGRTREEAIIRLKDVLELATLKDENTALRTALAAAESRLRQAEAERDATVAKVKRLSRKSDLDEGFIDFLTAKGDEL